MSKKPTKKSDSGKAWMQPRRDRVIKIAPEYHLIVSEGTKTEPQYFQTIKDAVNESFRNRVQLEIVGVGANTVSLFQKAKEVAEAGANVYKHVWIVYDKDDFSNENFDRVEQLCKVNSGAETTYHAAWSNQCIELWFLLHFGFLQSDLHRSEYWPKLTEFLKKIGAGKYEKNRNDIYQVLRPYVDDAIMNAKKLETINEGRLPSKSTPGTKVYVIIEMLRPYL